VREHGQLVRRIDTPPELKPFSASPSLRTSLPLPLAAVRNPELIAAFVSFAFLPAVHSICSASRALFACHHESAITATPDDVCNT
jgi:hypothetical protein